MIDGKLLFRKLLKRCNENKNLNSINSYPVTGTRAADDLPPIIMLVALLVVEPAGTVGPDVTLRWALGEEGGGGRRITDTTLCVCSHIRRNRRMLPDEKCLLH